MDQHGNYNGPTRPGGRFDELKLNVIVAAIMMTGGWLLIEAITWLATLIT